MSTGPFSPEIAAYLRLAQERSNLFSNDPEGGITLLLDPDEIREVERVTADRLAVQGLPRGWASVGIVFRDQYEMILRDAVEFPDGSRGTYIRAMGGAVTAPGVAVLPVHSGRVILLHHFRHATRAWHLEIPRGFGVAGETSEANARRELIEETGATIEALIPLGKVYPNSGATAEYVDLFWASVTALGAIDTHEGISHSIALSPTELEAAIGEGNIADGFTIAAYARARARGLLTFPSPDANETR